MQSLKQQPTKAPKSPLSLRRILELGAKTEETLLFFEDRLSTMMPMSKGSRRSALHDFASPFVGMTSTWCPAGRNRKTRCSMNLERSICSGLGEYVPVAKHRNVFLLTIVSIVSSMSAMISSRGASLSHSSPIATSRFLISWFVYASDFRLSASCASSDAAVLSERLRASSSAISAFFAASSVAILARL
jgi:hypothetical protein